MSSLAKYLEKYSLVSATESRFVSGRFRAALVVPLFAECPESLTGLFEEGASADDLIVCVVNQRAQVSPSESLLTAEFLAHWWREAPAEPQSTPAPLDPSKLGFPLFVHRQPEAFGRKFAGTLVVIDATRAGFQPGPKQGVGYARKLGMDLAAALYKERRLASAYAGTSDADVLLPRGYFDALVDAPPGAAGLLFPYRHQASAGVDEARLAWLEASFRYYVLGLHAAGSPYAFHSLGSALAVHLERYAEARGFPDRAAGEDFYLLSKLVRLGPLRRLQRPEVVVLGRESQRVPFGTGPSLLAARERSEQSSRIHSGVLVDDPIGFESLGRVLGRLRRFVEANPPAERPADAFPPGRLGEIEQQAVDESVRKLAPLLGACPTAAHRLARLFELFDGLGCLRYLHAVGAAWPKIAIEEAVVRATFLQAPLQLGHGAERDGPAVCSLLKGAEEALPELIDATPPGFRGVPPGPAKGLGTPPVIA